MTAAMILLSAYPPLDWLGIAIGALRVTALGLGVTGAWIAWRTFQDWRAKRREER